MCVILGWMDHFRYDDMKYDMTYTNAYLTFQIPLEFYS